MSMALRRDKGSGTIYFNNATQKWFASCPIGVYVNGRTKFARLSRAVATSCGLLN